MAITDCMQIKWHGLWLLLNHRKEPNGDETVLVAVARKPFKKGECGEADMRFKTMPAEVKPDATVEHQRASPESELAAIREATREYLGHPKNTGRVYDGVVSWVDTGGFAGELRVAFRECFDEVSVAKFFGENPCTVGWLEGIAVGGGIFPDSVITDADGNGPDLYAHVGKCATFLCRVLSPTSVKSNGPYTLPDAK